MASRKIAEAQANNEKRVKEMEKRLSQERDIKS